MGSYLRIVQDVRVFGLIDTQTSYKETSETIQVSMRCLPRGRENSPRKKKKEGAKRRKEIEVYASRNAWRDVSSRSDR